MPLATLLKLVLGLISLVLLATGGWLLWSWWQGELVPAADSAGLVFVRENWRLWSALSLLAWSFLGRIVVTPLLARGDTDPSRPRRQEGTVIDGGEGAQVYMERRGVDRGTPLVLSHGWGLDSTIWDYASRDLGQRHSLIVWDLPGLGRSRAKPVAITLPAFARALRHVVDASGAHKVVLIGHSIGGMTIQTLVRDHPDFVRERVAGIVLLNTTYTNPLRTMILSPLMLALRKPLLEPLFHLMAWLQPLVWIGAWQSYLSGSAHIANRFGFGRYVTRSQLEHTTLLATRNPPAVQAHGNLAMFRWDATGAMARLGVPLLVLGGDMDIVTKVEAGQRIAADGAGPIEIVGGVNHMGFLERAEVYHHAIETFVAGIGDAPAPSLATSRSQAFPDILSPNPVP